MNVKMAIAYLNYVVNAFYEKLNRLEFWRGLF